MRQGEYEEEDDDDDDDDDEVVPQQETTPPLPVSPTRHRVTSRATMYINFTLYDMYVTQ